MDPLPLRLPPGTDLRAHLEALPGRVGWTAAFVLAGIGSLDAARLRLAGATAAAALAGPLELLTLSGTLAPDGVHLHASVADAAGRVSGGHLLPGCTVRTTAEVLVLPLPAWSFARAPDPVTGYRELVVRPLGAAQP